MAFLPLIELAIVLLLIATIVTQILIPLSSGQPWFPILKARRSLEKKLDELHGVEKELELKKQIEKLQDELDKKGRK